VSALDAPAERLGARAVRNTMFVLGARIVSRLVSLVVVIVLANALGADGYGRYTTLIALSGLVAVVADLGFSPLYTREAARSPSQLGDYLGTMLLVKLVLSAAAFGILAMTLGLVGLMTLIVPGGCLLVATAYANLLRNSFYAVGRAEFDAIAIVGEIAIQAALILYGAHAHVSVSFYVWAYTASFVFTIIYSLTVIRIFGLGGVRFSLDLPLIRKWLPLALPFGLTFFLTNLYFRADVPILQHFRPFAEIGWYQFAYKPFEALQFIPLAIQAVVYPLLGVYYINDPTRLQLGYQRFFKVLVLLGWPLTVGTFVLAHPIGRLFRLFPESEPALRILAFGIVFLFANSAFYAMLNATNRQAFNAWATGLAAVINIILNLILIPSFGYLAASANTVLTECSLCVFGWWFVQRRARQLRLPWLRLSWRVLAAGTVTGAVLYPLAGLPLYVSATSGALVYLISVYMLRAVEPVEWELARRGLLARLGPHQV
jgi:O-antigen/teichoic acid export membrane protein